MVGGYPDLNDKEFVKKHNYVENLIWVLKYFPLILIFRFAFQKAFQSKPLKRKEMESYAK